MQMTHVEASCSEADASGDNVATGVPAAPVPDPATLAAIVPIAATPAPSPRAGFITGEKRTAECTEVEVGGSPPTVKLPELSERAIEVAAPVALMEPSKVEGVRANGVGIAGEGPGAAATAAAAAGEWRSKVTAATKTTRQVASSKLLKRLPLHWRKKSSALA